MFVVFSPEGQSLVGAVQNLPVLKIDPATRVNQTNPTNLDNMSLEPDHSNAHFQQDKALKQYEGVKHLNERKLIVKAFEVMTSPVVTSSPDSTLYEAWDLMQQHNIHHIPVLKEGLLIGIFSKSDLLNRVILNEDKQIEEARSNSVAEIMKHQVVATEPDTDIREVAVALTKYDIGALPIVTSTQTLLGIVTLSDLVKRLSKSPPIELYT
ncbi:MAG: CBS domain-containing protein [Thiotrichales bacterium]|nr:CBS domain-containing protein [Thiotrichales bacterium]